MTPSINQLFAMVWRSIANPREGAAEVLALGVPREALWLIFGVVVVLSTTLTAIVGIVVATNSSQVGFESVNPVTNGLFQLGVLLMLVYAVYFIGRAMGGTGSLEESVLLMSWLQFVLLCAQVVQVAISALISPVIGLLLVLALGVLFFWMLTNFVAVLHGFRSLAQVFLMILASAFVIGFALSIMLPVLGVDVPTFVGEV